MNNIAKMSLCRICLEEGADVPIFESKESYVPNNHNVFLKLSICLGEQIEDISGYPRNICELCLVTLNIASNFVKKFRESCKILKDSLHTVVKKEIIEINDNQYIYNDNQDGLLIQLENINPKAIHLNSAQHLIETVNTLQTKIESMKKKSDIKKLIIKENPKNKCKRSKSKRSIATLEDKTLCEDENLGLKLENVNVAADNERHFKKEIIVNGEEFEKTKESDTKLSKEIAHKPALCDVCGEVFPDQDKLTKHKNKIHYKSPVNCPTCNKLFYTSYNLKRHVLRTHAQKKNFVCSACGNCYAYQGEFTTHYNRVHGQKYKSKRVYKCSICDKSYACSKSVVIHERSIHTGERPATCSVCGTRFYHEDYLKEHMRLHTGETPFLCPVCGRGYAQRGNMKSHIRHVHKISHLDELTLKSLKPNYLRLMKL